MNVRFKVLMVCTGNICRSPTAEGVLRGKLAGAGLDRLVQVQSAGMVDYHQARRRICARSRPLPDVATTCRASGPANCGPTTSSGSTSCWQWRPNTSSG